jgi:hypothetical protein
MMGWETTNAFKIFVRKRQGKRPVGICRNKWESNVKMDL